MGACFRVWERISRPGEVVGGGLGPTGRGARVGGSRVPAPASSVARSPESVGSRRAAPRPRCCRPVVPAARHPGGMADMRLLPAVVLISPAKAGKIAHMLLPRERRE